MDNREREKFYSDKPDPDVEDEYELEPPDAEVTAAAERRGREAIEASQTTIDIDEIYRPVSRQRSEEILQNWFRGFKPRFQFRVKHLLIGMAVLAFALVLYRLQVLRTAIVLLVMGFVAGLYFYLQWQEQEAEEEATRRRLEMYERRRAHFEKSRDDADRDALP